MGISPSVRIFVSIFITSNLRRHSYDTARKIKGKQDAYCSKALAGHWDGLGEYPEDLQWEALVDVLRGRVKVCFM